MQDARQRDNIRTIEEAMRRRRNGLTLSEKITVHLDKVKKKEVISLLGSTFFQPHEEQGCNFMLRRTNLQRDEGRTLNIIDEIEAEANKTRELAEIEEGKDLTFDDYKD